MIRSYKWKVVRVIHPQEPRVCSSYISILPTPLRKLTDCSQVLREQKASALDSTLATKTENQVMSTLDVFAPEVSVALHNICRDIIKSYIVHEALSIKHGEVDNFNGPATRALRTIRE